MHYLTAIYKCALETYCMRGRGSVICTNHKTGEASVLTYSDRGYTLRAIASATPSYLSSNLAAWPLLTISEAEADKLDAAERAERRARLGTPVQSRRADGTFLTNGAVPARYR